MARCLGRTLASVALASFLFVHVHSVPLKAPVVHHPAVNATGRAFVVNSTSEVDANSTSTRSFDASKVNVTAEKEREARNLYQNLANERGLFEDPLELVKPLAGLINGDFGVGLVAPSIPGLKPDEGKGGKIDPSLMIAAAYSPIEPVIAPFRPLAMHFTGSTPSDVANLRPNYDLVYPFLDPPKNVLYAIKDDKDKNKIKFRQSDQEMFMQAGRLTPEQLAAYHQQVEQWKALQQQRSMNTRGFDAGLGAGFGTGFGGGFGGFGVPSIGLPSFGSGATSLFAAATKPVNPLVTPFYPFAAQITGASLADFTNLRPQNDLVFPFLNQPYNTLLPFKGDKDKDKDKFRADVTPQEVAAMVKSLAEAAKNGSNVRDVSDIPSSLLFGQKPIPNPVIDPLGALVTLDMLEFRPLSHLVYPFLPADKNPFLSLLYYLTPSLRSNETRSDGFGGGLVDDDLKGLGLPGLGLGDDKDLGLPGIRPFSDLILPFLPTDVNPLLSLLYYITPYPFRTQQRMAMADKMIASALASRENLSPVEAVAHARELQGVVAATELHHTLKRLGLGDVSAPLLSTVYPQLGATRQLLGGLGDLFEDVGDLFDGGNDDDKKLGKIPGAAPILHYFYPYLPKRILKPFKPLVDKRLIGTKSGIFGDFDLEDISDLFDGGKGKPKKLGHIPGAAPILHYFYPYLPKRVLKPFKPLVDKRMAAIMSKVNDAVNERLFEVKYAAAVSAMKKARFQRRLLENLSKMNGRTARQFFDDSDAAGEDTVDEGEKEPEGEETEADKEELAGEESSSDLFAGQNQSLLGQLFRFFVPDSSKMENMVKSSNRDARALLQSSELSGEEGLPAALDAIQNSVDEHAPFPLNDIFRWWTHKRGFVSRSARSLERPSFKESFAALKKLQKRSLALNDTFAVEISKNHTREGRNLGGLMSNLLPFPFNLLTSFLPTASRAEEAGDETAAEDDTNTESMDDEYDAAYEESGVSAQEGDRRMASMIGPFMPEPLNALVAGLFPFRSMEQDFEQESNIEDGTASDGNTNSQERNDEAMKAFKDSLAAIREEYLAKQDSTGAQEAAANAQDLAAQAMSNF